ncbi:amino acid permease [Nocardia amikacinitolerans]|uniref:amino acid permease n=1 Tax=Nocardia amikacinitolerans TaxID=756689 RepID=UPI0020A4FCE5|nr:amino acid permease [Nocardia amikacinitolerans]
MTAVVPHSPATPRGKTNAPHRRGLTVPTGLAGLSLDAMASVSYGPEAIVLVLAAAGAAGLGATLPVTLAIVALLAVLIASYRQVIAAFPDGGGAYAVAKRHLGHRTSLVAAASLIANAVPSFAEPRVRRAQRAEVALGVLLGTMLIGLAVLIEKFSLHPVEGVTVLSQLTEAALGHGFGYYVVQFATVVLLALAANTSYGGLPTLTRILADDNCLPHRFAVSSPRQVYRYGVLTLGVSAAALLIGAGGTMNALVPLFAIGVFVGFTIAQAGMVRHWWLTRGAGWRMRLGLNGFGALLTTAAALVTTAMKFTEGAWLIVLVLPALVFAMQRVRAAYRRIGHCRAAGAIPAQPRASGTVVVVPISEVSELSREALSAALSMGSDVVAVHVCLPGESVRAFTKAWEAWHPEVRLVLLEDSDATVGGPVARYLRENFAGRRKVVVVAEVDPPGGWDRVLPSHRSDELERELRRMTDTVVCHLRVQVA